MFGIFLAVGSCAQNFDGDRMESIWPLEADSACIGPDGQIFAALLSPPGVPPAPPFARSATGDVTVAVDGYLYTDLLPVSASPTDHLEALAEQISAKGFEAGLERILGGAYSLAVVDSGRQLTHVSTDHLGSLPLYYARAGDGAWLVSTNPVALARTGLIDTTPDPVGMAEWAYVGYTFGDRFVLQGIKIFRQWERLEWNHGSGKGRILTNPNPFWQVLPSEDYPTPEEMAEGFRLSVERTSELEPKPAHFQSSGLDSRLILAAWPAGYDPVCYTYGDPDSLEVGIARSIAEHRGSDWRHVWITGDEAADNIGRMFDATGFVVYPDRYFAARAAAEDGHRGILDGWVGGVWPGGLYHRNDHYFSKRSRIARYFRVYRDQTISQVGMDRLAATIFEDCREVRDERVLRALTTEEAAEEWKSLIPAMIADVRGELERYRPANDSVGLAWREFLIANRARHAITLQGVMCRIFARVYYPITADIEMHRLQTRYPMKATAYYREYIRVLQQGFPEYGKQLYGASMLPLGRPVLAHHVSKFLLSHNLRIPLLSGRTEKRERDANSWRAWFRQSERLRETARTELAQSNLLDAPRFDATMANASESPIRAVGKLFHLASLARWTRMSSPGIG
ncbi:hypothetical protein ACFL3S_01085 [Gemmatimonadota bacterium]